MRRSLYVHRSPVYDELVVINRRPPCWSDVCQEYIDLGHSQLVSFEVFSIFTGILTLPPFPGVAVIEQDAEEIEAMFPEGRRRR